MFNTLPISRHQIKVFIGTFVAIFIMMVLYNLGVSSPLKSFHTIKAPEKTDVMKVIRPKLEQKNNNFKLKKESYLIKQTYAAEQNDFEGAAGYITADLDTGKIINEKNGDQHVPIASITKIMTAVVALDLANSSDVFTVSEQAAAMPPTKVVLIAGQKMTLEELRNASLLTSANDATEEIKNSINKKYNEEIFVKAMNEKAIVLGMKNSHFTNPQGFDFGDNYSSPKDVALLTQYALSHYPLIADIVKTDYQFLAQDPNHTQFDLYNWNGLLGVYPDTLGAKIGNTAAAGYTTSVVANRNGKKIIAVVLGAPGIIERDSWAAELLDLGYNQTLGLTPVGITKDQLLAKYSTWQYGN